MLVLLAVSCRGSFVVSLLSQLTVRVMPIGTRRLYLQSAACYLKIAGTVEGMTSTEQPLDPALQQEEDNVLAASFVARGPDGGLVVVLGPPSKVWVAHAVLYLHGFDITPRAGEFWATDNLELWAREEESAPLVKVAAGHINEVLSETAHARPIYFYEYLKYMD